MLVRMRASLRAVARRRLPYVVVVACACGGGSGEGTVRGPGEIQVSADTSSVQQSLFDSSVPEPVDDEEGLQEMDDPGPPLFPTTIGTLSITLVTADVEHAGTDDNELSVCITDTDCVTMDLPDVDDFRRGEVDVYHAEGLDLPRTSVDRVEIRSTSGADRFEPGCLMLAFDGEPVYCNDSLEGLWFGDGGPKELSSWVDPSGLHMACDRCEPSPLTHGPIVGPSPPGEGTVWVRTDATRSVALRVSETADLADGVVVDWLYPLPDTDYSGTLSVSGLEPGAAYRWAVEVDGVVQGDGGTFSSPPELGSTGVWRFSFGSCTNYDEQPIFAAIGALEPDLFLFVGDNHYANSDDLGSLRWYYRWAHSRPERAALMADVPILATWDDHDFVGNNTLGTEPGRDVALRAFGEYWPSPSAGTPDTAGVFYNFRYADLEFILLDDRYWRGVEGDMLGSGQTEWLEEVLLHSEATFKFVVTGSQWTSYGSSDSWATYLTARDALFEFIDAHAIEGVVLLSGDIHNSEVRLIQRPGGYALPELTSSPLANWNFSCKSDSEQLAGSCYDDGTSFIEVEVDTTLDDPVVVARVRDGDGVILFDTSFAHSSLRP